MKISDKIIGLLLIYLLVLTLVDGFFLFTNLDKSPSFTQYFLAAGGIFVMLVVKLFEKSRT